MKVNSTKDVRGVERVAQRDEGVKQPTVPARQEDRVTIEANPVAEQLSNFKLRAVPSRNARLEQLETAIRAGQYQPDAGQLAEKLLSAAEIDARLRAMMKG